ncbi:MAG: hypothetical protein ACPL6C_02630 [bacterium]
MAFLKSEAKINIVMVGVIFLSFTRIFAQGSSRPLVIKAVMAGPSITLSTTRWELGSVDPEHRYIMPRGILVRNSGGVTIDISLYSLPTAGGWDLHIGDPYPPENTFSLYALAGSPSDTIRPPSERDFLLPSPTRNQLTYAPDEINSNRFYNATWSILPGITSTGVHLPAKVPGYPMRNSFSLFLMLITPIRSTVEPNQTIEVYIEARLLD